ncbi:hypothetical protein TanjilG_31459 [Lupinus angustifolius]|uniref:Uncharacterized protein n=1 Tax=Lupinus angustifolius TaxID=3871 RepID=A0A4P1RU86_LUPAN|nr:hypothetical protein TanjilG_31459 [Lupinus angustifolius]
MVNVPSDSDLDSCKDRDSCWGDHFLLEEEDDEVADSLANESILERKVNQKVSNSGSLSNMLVDVSVDSPNLSASGASLAPSCPPLLPFKEGPLSPSKGEQVLVPYLNCCDKNVSICVGPKGDTPKEVSGPWVMDSDKDRRDPLFSYSNVPLLGSHVVGASSCRNKGQKIKIQRKKKFYPPLVLKPSSHRYKDQASNNSVKKKAIQKEVESNDNLHSSISNSIDDSHVRCVNRLLLKEAGNTAAVPEGTNAAVPAGNTDAVPAGNTAAVPAGSFCITDALSG